MSEIFLKVEVKLYGLLRNYRPTEATGAPHHPFSLEVTAEATAVDIATQLRIEDGLVTAVAINGQTAELDTGLQEGDQVSLFPPSVGGSEPLQVFIAGVMQANRRDTQIESQDYRIQIAAALKKQIPDVQIIDPWAENPNSVNYSEEQARHTFLTMTNKASEADLLIAYLPLPSMGTAMEMWQAHQGNRTIIIAITPFVHHWAVRFTAHHTLPDLPAFFALLENGRFLQDIVPQALCNRQ